MKPKIFMVSFLKRGVDFILYLIHSRTAGLLIVFVLLGAVSLTVIVAQQQQQIRQRAADDDNPTCGGSGQECCMFPGIPECQGGYRCDHAIDGDYCVPLSILTPIPILTRTPTPRPGQICGNEYCQPGSHCVNDPYGDYCELDSPPTRTPTPIRTPTPTPRASTPTPVACIQNNGTCLDRTSCPNGYTQLLRSCGSGEDICCTQAPASTRTPTPRPVTPTRTPTSTPTRVPTLTPTRSPTRTPTPARVPSPTRIPSPTLTVSPTLVLTRTPTPKSISITPSPTISYCSLKSQGDANCDGKINILDFNLWKNEFLSELEGKTTKRDSDFNKDGLVSIVDFNIWRTGFN